MYFVCLCSMLGFWPLSCVVNISSWAWFCTRYILQILWNLLRKSWCFQDKVLIVDVILDFIWWGAELKVTQPWVFLTHHIKLKYLRWSSTPRGKLCQNVPLVISMGSTVCLVSSHPLASLCLWVIFLVLFVFPISKFSRKQNSILSAHLIMIYHYQNHGFYQLRYLIQIYII